MPNARIVKFVGIGPKNYGFMITVFNAVCVKFATNDIMQPNLIGSDLFARIRVKINISWSVETKS